MGSPYFSQGPRECLDFGNRMHLRRAEGRAPFSPICFIFVIVRVRGVAEGIFRIKP